MVSVLTDTLGAVVVTGSKSVGSGRLRFSRTASVAIALTILISTGAERSTFTGAGVPRVGFIPASMLFSDGCTGCSKSCKPDRSI